MSKWLDSILLTTQSLLQHNSHKLDSSQICLTRELWQLSKFQCFTSHFAFIVFVCFILFTTPAHRSSTVNTLSAPSPSWHCQHLCQLVSVGIHHIINIPLILSASPYGWFWLFLVRSLIWNITLVSQFYRCCQIWWILPRFLLLLQISSTFTYYKTVKLKIYIFFQLERVVMTPK